MRDDWKQVLKRFVPEPVVAATRPVRFYFRPQRRFDRRFKVHTDGMIEPEEFDVEGSNVAHASGYEPTPAPPFLRILRSIPLEYERYTFADLGSGKGAALLYAAEFPFKRIIGIEFSPLLHRIAERNLANYRSRTIRTMKCRDCRSLCMDVTTWPIPPEPTLFYLFNPFTGKVLDTVVARLGRSLQDHPRDVVVIYYHPLSRHAAWDHADFLRQVRRDQDHTIYRSPSE